MAFVIHLPLTDFIISNLTKEVLRNNFYGNESEGKCFPEN